MTTKTKIDTHKIVRDNPKIDAQKFAEVSRIIQELRKAGIPPKQYDIVQPFTRHYHDTNEPE